MEIKYLRKNLKGLERTYENCQHHAKKLLPFVKVLHPIIENLDIAQWVQAPNTHRLVTKDNRVIVIRGYKNDLNRWDGLQVSISANGIRCRVDDEKLLFKINNIKEVPLIGIILNKLIEGE